MTKRKPQELAPLLSNGDLEKLANGIPQLTKDRKFNVYERLIFVRGTYERDRQAKHARIAALEAELADTEMQLARADLIIMRYENE